MRDSSGRTAASVFPPAVGATSSAWLPASTGSIACSCNGRRDRQPSELTRWCATAGCSRSTPRLTLVELHVVGRQRPGTRLAFLQGQLGLADGQGVVLTRMEVGKLVHTV